MPAWMGSIRSSSLLYLLGAAFGLAALVVAGCTSPCRATSTTSPLSENINVTQLVVGPDGRVITRAHRARPRSRPPSTSSTSGPWKKLRNYSLRRSACSSLKPASASGGSWPVQVVRPIGHITDVVATSRPPTSPGGSPSGPVTTSSGSWPTTPKADAMRSAVSTTPFDAQRRRFIQDTSTSCATRFAVMPAELDVVRRPDATADDLREGGGRGRPHRRPPPTSSTTSSSSPATGPPPSP